MHREGTKQKISQNNDTQNSPDDHNTTSTHTHPSNAPTEYICIEHIQERKKLQKRAQEKISKEEPNRGSELPYLYEDESSTGRQAMSCVGENNL